VSFYNYRWWVFLGAVVNTAVNFVWERVLIQFLERHFDRKETENREQEFEKKMQELKPAEAK